jgi:mono/diheme cytochrome c family protein
MHMSDDPTSRQITPREADGAGDASSALTPALEGEQRSVERFSAGPKAHMVGLTEERGAQIVRQSANARTWVFLAILLIVVFIPIYWFVESGVPALGTQGRMEQTADVQYVTDVARGYELYLANCASCHGDNGQGGVGPPLNNQPKLYNALTADGQPGTGHLNPIYIDNVLSVGGRYVCGDPNSLMLAFKDPAGPLNYRQVEELIAWITASSEVTFEYEPESHEAGAEVPEPVVVSGWRDPDWQPEPGATPPPACWRNPSGVIGGSAPAATPAPENGEAATPEPVTGGTEDAPRIVKLQAAPDLHFKDEAGNNVTELMVAAGETIQFEIDNVSGFDHNFWIGTPEQLGASNATTDVGIPTWQSGVQTVTWTVSGEGLQFACTVPGHYTTMHADIVIQG